MTAAASVSRRSFLISFRVSHVPTRLPAEGEVLLPRKRSIAVTRILMLAAVESRALSHATTMNGWHSVERNATIVPFYVGRVPLYDIAVWGTQASLILCVLYSFLYVGHLCLPIMPDVAAIAFETRLFFFLTLFIILISSMTVLHLVH